MIEKVCENCGKKFNTYPSNNRKFCSHKCSIIKAWETRKRAKTVKIICKYCGKEFELKASETRVKLGQVNYCSLSCRDKAQMTGKIINCPQCGKEFYSTRRKFCSKKCACDYRSENYLNKKNYEENGYIIHHVRGYNKKGNAREHRLIMEQYLGRRLEKNEVVHHIDENKKNNCIDNLKLMTRGEHSKLHRQKEFKSGKILFK